MKLQHASILFVVIFLAFFTTISIKGNDLCNVTEENIELNNKLDKAAYDAALGMVEYDISSDLSVNKDEAVDLFYRSLAASLGRTSLGTIKEFSFYIPVILITDVNGFYISFLNNNENVEKEELQRTWTEKIPYIYADDDGYIYYFNIGDKKDFITVYDTYTYEYYSGYRNDLKEQCNASLITSENYDEVRVASVISSIEKQMNYYINNHNLLAKRYGISYSFYLPVIDRESWIRTVDDISFLFVFQGYPYQTVDNEYYNRVVLSGSRVSKSSQYYINDIDGELTYHRCECPLLDSKDIGYSTKEMCALHGAYPCEYCKP